MQYNLLSRLHFKLAYLFFEYPTVFKGNLRAISFYFSVIVCFIVFILSKNLKMSNNL